MKPVNTFYLLTIFAKAPPYWLGLKYASDNDSTWGKQKRNTQFNWDKIYVQSDLREPRAPWQEHYVLSNTLAELW